MTTDLALDALLLAKVVENLSLKTGKTLRGTCSQLRHVCNRATTRIVLGAQDDIAFDPGSLFLDSFPFLRDLTIRDIPWLDDEDLVCFAETNAAQLRRVSHLRISGCPGLSISAFNQIVTDTCTLDLHTLVLHAPESLQWASVPLPRHLQRLDLAGAQLSEQDLLQAAKGPGLTHESPALTSLCLKGCLKIGPALTFLPALPALCELDLNSCFKVNDHSVAALVGTLPKPSQVLPPAMDASPAASPLDITTCPGEPAAARAAAPADAAPYTPIAKGYEEGLAEGYPPCKHSTAASCSSEISNQPEVGSSCSQGHCTSSEGLPSTSSSCNREQAKASSSSISVKSTSSSTSSSSHVTVSCPALPLPRLQHAAAAVTRGLTHLNLSYTRVTDSGMAQLARLTSLEQLSLKGCNVGDAGVQHLLHLQGLTSLDLKHCHRVTEDGVTSLVPLTQLQHFSYGYTSMPMAAVVCEALGLNHPHLTSLDLLSDQITDACLMSLGRLNHLQRLKLYQVQVTPEGLLQLAAAPAGKVLTHLTLFGAGWLKQLECIGSLAALKDLHLGGIGLKAAALNSLTQLTHLRCLTLENEPHLGHGLVLQLLMHCGVVGHLEELRVRGCHRVSEEGLRELVSQCTASVTQVWFAPHVEYSTDDEEEGWACCYPAEDQ